MATSAGRINASNWRQIGIEVRPTEAELAWRSIPWHADLWSAREQAARTGKPVFLWAMNGNPLGCV